MSFQFSQQLIEKTIRVFKEEDDLVLTPELANEYLHRLAGLYLAFAGGGNRVSEGAVPPPLT